MPAEQQQQTDDVMNMNHQIDAWRQQYENHLQSVQRLELEAANALGMAKQARLQRSNARPDARADAQAVGLMQEWKRRLDTAKLERGLMLTLSNSISNLQRKQVLLRKLAVTKRLAELSTFPISTDEATKVFDAANERQEDLQAIEEAADSSAQLLNDESSGEMSIPDSEELMKLDELIRQDSMPPPLAPEELLHVGDPMMGGSSRRVVDANVAPVSDTSRDILERLQASLRDDSQLQQQRREERPHSMYVSAA